MTSVSPDILEAFKEFDSPTVFNAILAMEGKPNEDYTDHTINCLLPEFGPIIGYAVTAEVTTNDEDSAAVSWDDYYTMLDERDGPLIAMIKDVDSRPGRGASFGDGMATLHKTLGVVGVIVDGTVRDLAGIRRVGMPTYAWGTVPGHGQFNVTRFDAPLTVGQLRVHPGDLLFADGDGCQRIPNDRAEEVLDHARQVREKEAGIFEFYGSADFTLAEMIARKAKKK